MCLACNPSVIMTYERCLNWVWAEVSSAVKWPAWRDPASRARKITLSPAGCNGPGMHTLAGRQDFSSAKVSSPTVCIYHFSSTHAWPWWAGKDQPEDFRHHHSRLLVCPITKSSFCPLVLTSVHSPVTQKPWKTARTKFLKHLVDPDILEE